MTAPGEETGSGGNGPGDAADGGGDNGGGRKRLTGTRAWILGVGGVLAALVFALANFEKLIQAGRSFLTTGCTSVDVTVQAFEEIPYSLKSTFTSRHFAGERDFYWFLLTADNRCWRQDMEIEVAFEVDQGDAIICHATETIWLEARQHDFEKTMDPEFYFTNPGERSGLQVLWRVFPVNGEETTGDRHPIRSGVKQLTVWPRERFLWDWKDPQGKDVGKDFLLATLAAWTSEPKKTITRLAKRLTGETHAAFGREGPPDTQAWTEKWMARAYAHLFGEASPYDIRVMQGDPLLRARDIQTPVRILENAKLETVTVDFVEAALLLGAVAREPFDSYNLALVRTPARRFYLAWHIDGGRWSVIDLQQTSVPFEQNFEAATQAVRPQLEADEVREQILAEEGDGVYFAGKDQLVAVNFRRAQKAQDIDTSPDATGGCVKSGPLDLFDDSESVSE